MGRARQLAGRGNNDSLILNSSAASTDVGELLLLNGTDASSSNAGFSTLQEDATGNAFDGGPFRFSEVPINVVNPAFRARMDDTGNQTLSDGTHTKIELKAIEYDVGGYFDTATNYRYTPLIAGYYHITGSASAVGSVDSDDIITRIYKNGAFHSQGRLSLGGLTNDDFSLSLVSVTDVIHMNGTTDYLELFVYVDTEDGGNPTISDNGGSTFLTGHLLTRTS
jgi:hypothetical protein